MKVRQQCLGCRARLAKENEAAEYIGLDLPTFRAWVRCGRLPQPLPDCGKYDLKAIDVALDGISGLGGATRALDTWREQRAIRGE
jgi:hypothetical protein